MLNLERWGIESKDLQSSMESKDVVSFFFQKQSHNS